MPEAADGHPVSDDAVIHNEQAGESTSTDQSNPSGASSESSSTGESTASGESFFSGESTASGERLATGQLDWSSAIGLAREEAELQPMRKTYRCPKCSHEMPCVRFTYRPSWKKTMHGKYRPQWYS